MPERDENAVGMPRVAVAIVVPSGASGRVSSVRTRCRRAPGQDRTVTRIAAIRLAIWVKCSTSWGVSARFRTACSR